VVGFVCARVPTDGAKATIATAGTGGKATGGVYVGILNSVARRARAYWLRISLIPSPPGYPARLPNFRSSAWRAQGMVEVFAAGGFCVQATRSGTQGRELSTLQPLRARRARSLRPGWARRCRWGRRFELLPGEPGMRGNSAGRFDCCDRTDHSFKVFPDGGLLYGMAPVVQTNLHYHGSEELGYGRAMYRAFVKHARENPLRISTGNRMVFGDTCAPKTAQQSVYRSQCSRNVRALL